jgi:tyrosyl-tRNA synthetase
LAVAAEENFEKVFQKKGLPDEIPEAKITASEAVWLPQLLVDISLVKSTSDGRRMIKQNAVSINGEKVSDENTAVDPVGEVLFKVGKRRFCKVIFT